MTTRRAGTTLGLLTGAALLVVACGGSAATTAPTTPPVTQAPPTQAASSEAAPSQGPGLSFALPSFHANANLEKLIPTQLGGEAVTTQSMSGAQFLGTPNNEVAGVLSGMGKQPSDLSVAFGFNMHVSVIAFQINGVPGNTILEAFKNSSTDAGAITDASFGGKAVKKLTPKDASGVSYIYTTQDVVFVVSGAELTDALLNEAFSKLP